MAKHNAQKKTLYLLNHVCSIFIAVAYVLLLCVKACEVLAVVSFVQPLGFFAADGVRRGLFWVVIVPFLGFVTLTIVRRIINRPRPYEVDGIPPLIEKDTSGKSFPSRHVFSAYMIALTFLLATTWTWLGEVH